MPPRQFWYVIPKSEQYLWLFIICSRSWKAVFETGHEPGAQGKAVFETRNEPGTPGYDMKSDIGVKIFLHSNTMF